MRSDGSGLASCDAVDLQRCRVHPKIGLRYAVCEVCRRACHIMLSCPGCGLARCPEHRWTRQESLRHPCWLAPVGSLLPDIAAAYDLQEETERRRAARESRPWIDPIYNSRASIAVSCDGRSEAGDTRRAPAVGDDGDDEEQL